MPGVRWLDADVAGLDAGAGRVVALAGGGVAFGRVSFRAEEDASEEVDAVIPGKRGSNRRAPKAIVRARAITEMGKVVRPRARARGRVP